jgi:hypothetical protein
MASALQRVVLSWPTPITALMGDEGGVPAVGTAQTLHPKSWMQVARVGNFVSQRYGKFAITKDDLTQMLSNFRTITPKAPTKLPVDYDHLSMDPQKPGDGMAAGWIADLQLRENGAELWALVEWTPSAADAIKSRQYQFVSPSFVKDYVYKDGNVIGTTLLAAAITNHPFLEGMAALTLSAGLREFGMLINMAADDAAASRGGTVEPGQKCTVKDEEVQKPEQLGVVFTVGQVLGEGENTFVSLLAPDGTVAEWFRIDELEAAPADGATGPDIAAPMTEVPTESADAPQLAAPLAEKQTETTGTLAPNPPGAPASVPKFPIHPIPATAQVGMHARRERHMKTYELQDVTGNTVRVSEEALAGIGDANDLRQQVIDLSAQVEVMANAAASAEARTRKMEATTVLDGLSKKGLITRQMRQWAEKTYVGTEINLSGLREWAALQTHPVVEVGKERGSSAGDVPEVKDLANRLVSLAQKIERERRISYRDALIAASKEDPEASAAYFDQFQQVQ